jgi:hypothetical protein
MSCSMPQEDKSEGIRQLEHLGYTEIVTTDPDMLETCCGEGYAYSNKFSAKDHNGIEVHGCICANYGDAVVIKFTAE